MPVTFTVSDDGSFVWAITSGSLTSEELFDYEQETATDERIRPGFRELFDVTSSEQVQITKETMEEIHNLGMKNPKKGYGNKLAIVAKGESFDYARYYEQIVQSNLQNVIVFNSINTALLWLGVSQEESTKMLACRNSS
ncbi:MAG: hypothetical protein GY869_21245 [Planctomycetes bacterium]|nr:hypothetical protein [Planctomycetota bacterium]